MSVNPGFGGQSFIPGTIQKVKELKEMIREFHPDVLIEVDGGIDLVNARALVGEGADILVAGNTIFSSPDPSGTIQQLKQPG